MDQNLGSELNPPPGSIDRSRVLDVRPLRCLAPLFPNQPGMSSTSNPQSTPFVCVPPTGPFPSGVRPFYPFAGPTDSQHAPFTTQPANFSYGNDIPAPVPLNSFRTPTHQANGGTGRSKRGSKSRTSGSIGVEDDSYSDYQSNQYAGDYGVNSDDVDDDSYSGKRKGRPRKKRVHHVEEVDVESLVNGFLSGFKLTELDESKRGNGDSEVTAIVLLIYDLLRRRLTQLEEAKDLTFGIARRPDLKAGALLSTKGVKTNSTKRIGHVPGVEVGDIFFFRMELCIVGLHSPSMAGIDYISVKVTMDEEPVAVSIVSSGGYDDDGEDGDILIYSGQGGLKDGRMSDQKLERGNLAMEKSLHRANEVRVIRGVKEFQNSTGKIYVYDGLYKIQESWAEKNRSGCNVFKYKLVRIPGQPEAFTLWKSIQQWKDGVATRAGVIIPDITSNAEATPVCLVNDVDDEKGPAYFTYVSSLIYSKPFTSPDEPYTGCKCMGGCQPGGTDCPCNKKNGGYLLYSSIGVLMAHKSLIHECGASCACPPNCRNRMSQMGPKARLEVFKTKNRGWGLRSWDSIRAGGFICEYAGEVVDAGDAMNEIEDNNYIFDATRIYEPLMGIQDEDESIGPRKVPFHLAINAKNKGNVARFMNHSCSPNVMWMPVLRRSESNSFLHVAFFALRHVPPLQELTFDYGRVPPEKGNRGRKKCLCGSVKCRGYFC